MSTNRFTLVRHLSPFVLAATVTAVGLMASVAHAGQIKVAKEALELDDKGNLTKAGKSAPTGEIPSEPGEEIWPLFVWAKLDKGAPGPLYFEFYGKLPGDNKPYKVAWHHEVSDYDGGEYVSASFNLEGNFGFNKDKSYTIKAVQLDDKKGTMVLAEGKFSLTWTEPEPDEDDGDDGDDGEEDDGHSDEQDELDSLGGDDPASGDGPPPVAPPPKKGCNVDPTEHGAPGVLVLLALGFAFRRRRD